MKMKNTKNTSDTYPHIRNRANNRMKTWDNSVNSRINVKKL